MLFFETPARPYQEVARRLGLAAGSIGFIRGRCLDPPAPRAGEDGLPVSARRRGGGRARERRDASTRSWRAWRTTAQPAQVPRPTPPARARGRRWRGSARPSSEKVRVDVKEALALAEAAELIARKLRGAGGAGPRACARRATRSTRLNEHRAAVEHHERGRRACSRSAGKPTEVGRTLSTSIQPLILLGEYERAEAGGGAGARDLHPRRRRRCGWRAWRSTSATSTTARTASRRRSAATSRPTSGCSRSANVGGHRGGAGQHGHVPHHA